MAVLDKAVYTHRSLKTGSTHAMWRSNGAGQESGGRREHGPQLLLGFPGKEPVRRLRCAE